VPSSLRKENITGASAEQIARMVGSKQPVIPPASEAEQAAALAAARDANAALEPQTAATPANGNGAAGSVDLATFVDARLRPAIRERFGGPGVSIQAKMNGTCHAMSWQDGILTLGFYAEDFRKQKVETEHRKQIEEVASTLLGSPVSLRCIIAPKPAREVKSPLVQHAVENRGAKIVSDE
jgi:hypothetical protein